MKQLNRWRKNESKLSKVFRNGVAWLLICGFISFGLASSILGQTPSGGKDAKAADTSKGSVQRDSADQPPMYVEHHSRKGAIAATVVGLGFIGLGAWLLATGSSSTCQGGYVYDHGWAYPCKRLSWLDMERNRKVAGGIGIGFGSFMTVLGLKLMKRPIGSAWMHRRGPDSKSRSSSAAR